eukprot:3446360-Pleurochrysis_carterae.AAC.2
MPRLFPMRRQLVVLEHPDHRLEPSGARRRPPPPLLKQRMQQPRRQHHARHAAQHRRAPVRALVRALVRAARRAVACPLLFLLGGARLGLLHGVGLESGGVRALLGRERLGHHQRRRVARA